MMQLIPRRKFFGNNCFSQCTISPCGSKIALLGPGSIYPAIWIGHISDCKLSDFYNHDLGRNITYLQWSPNGKFLLFCADSEGNESWHIYRFDITDNKLVDLTPYEGIYGHIHAVEKGSKIAVQLNIRDPHWHDLYLLDIETGELSLVFENRIQVAKYCVDRNLKLRSIARISNEHDSLIFEFLGDNESTEFMRVPIDAMDQYEMIGYNALSDHLFFLDASKKDKALISKISLGTLETQILLQHNKADIDLYTWDPKSFEIDAASGEFERREWITQSKDRQKDFECINAYIDDDEDFDISARSQDDQVWIISSFGALPGRYWLYNRIEHKLFKLFEDLSSLYRQSLPKKTIHKIKARDGLNLIVYKTRPSTSISQTKPLPTVLVVHGGPWWRDYYRYDALHGWLADRGYLVLGVNFRGSKGYGDAFLKAGYHEWGGKMQDDLLDTVNWAVKERLADRNRLCIMGESYGGYATLAALTFEPSIFKCGVSICGLADLMSCMKIMPPHWTYVSERTRRRVGSPNSEEGRKLLFERSPLHKLHHIEAPLLIVHGKNDVRVLKSEADQIASSLRKNEKDFLYLLFEDEGHAISKSKNKMCLYAIMESFLGQHLGGAIEPISDELNDVNVIIEDEKQNIPKWIS